MTPWRPQRKPLPGPRPACAATRPVSDLEVITFRPEPGQYAWTFGGAANYTSIAKMARRYLAPAGVMDDAHARLRDLAGEYRS